MTEIKSTPVDMRALKSLTSTALRLHKAADISTRKARIAQATAVFAVVESGVIGTDQGKAVGWTTQGDYAAAIGASAGGLTGLKRLGKALDLGIDPDGADADLWSVLSSKAGVKEVGALFTDDATADSIREGMADLFDKNGKRKPAKVESGEEPGKDDENKRVPVKTRQDIVAVLASIESVLHSLSDADQDKVETHMLKMVAANKNRRRLLADKAAKDAAKSA